MNRRIFKKKKNSKIEEMIAEDNQEIEQEEREMIRGIFGLGETSHQEWSFENTCL
jgi:CBS domain containing-hemolysin-like protein